MGSMHIWKSTIHVRTTLAGIQTGFQGMFLMLQKVNVKLFSAVQKWLFMCMELHKDIDTLWGHYECLISSCGLSSDKS